jgi:anti-anti-sigma factor
MELQESKVGSFCVVSIAGRLDTSNFGELEKKLLGLMDKGEKEIVVNCAELVYVSSSGLRVLLMILKKIAAVGGKFYLCNLQDNIREIFEISGFTTIFKIFTTVDEAVS